MPTGRTGPTRRLRKRFAAAFRRSRRFGNAWWERGFQETLHGAKREKPPTEKLLDGEQEARVIALRLGPAPPGYANWTLRLLARQVVALEIVDSISHEAVRRTLKKTV